MMSLLKLFTSHKGVDITVEQLGRDHWSYKTSTGIWGTGQKTSSQAIKSAEEAIDSADENPKPWKLFKI